MRRKKSKEPPKKTEYAQNQLVIKLKQPLTDLKTKNGNLLSEKLNKENISLEEIDFLSLPLFLQEIEKNML